MFAPLLRNVAISGVAYAIVSGVGLFLAPLLIATYGLAGHGQILVARMFLPSGFFALFDVGVSETATRKVANARSTLRWDDVEKFPVLLAVERDGAPIARSEGGPVLLVLPLSLEASLAARYGENGFCFYVTGIAVGRPRPRVGVSGKVREPEELARLGLEGVVPLGTRAVPEAGQVEADRGNALLRQLPREPDVEAMRSDAVDDPRVEEDHPHPFRVGARPLTRT